MIQEIVKFGTPSLVAESRPVDHFDDELRQLADDLLETMYSAEGVGLAAPQVGVNEQVCVVDASGGRRQGEQIVLVNPEVTDPSGCQVGEEGCLSIPGFTAMVERPERIHLSARDIKGQPVELAAEGFLARVICHEVDHLSGILYLDRISPLKAQLIKRKIRKLIKAGEWS